MIAVRKAFLFLLAAGVAHGVDGFSAQEGRGKRIYLSGASASGTEIPVTIGQLTGLSAAKFPCVNCHGRDGRGKPEGDVTPADISWDTLTRASLNRPGASGRGRPAYTDRTLIRAITMGIDSSGGTLNAFMPKFQLSRTDAENLIAYLKKLAEDFDPGLSLNSIRMGVLLPASGQTGAGAIGMREALTDYFDGINRGGGLYGRKIDLRFLASVSDSGDIFALVSGFMTGVEAEVAGALETREIPLVGAFTLFPRIEDPLNRYVFYIDGGVPDQASALLNFALRDGAATKTVIVLHSENTAVAEAAGKAAAQARSLGARAVSEATAPALQQMHPDVLLILAPADDAEDWIDSISELSPIPEVLVPGLFAGDLLKRIPPRLASHFHFAVYPSAGGDLAIRNQAVASAGILVEALKRAGRNLSRETLIEQLEGLYEFQSGFGPVVTFGPNRRVGISPSGISIRSLKTIP